VADGTIALPARVAQAAHSRAVPPSGVSVESLLTSTARDDTPARAIKKLMRADLICIDDIDLLPVSNDTAEAVYRVVYAPYEKRTIALQPAGFDEVMLKTIANHCRPPVAPRPHRRHHRRLDSPHPSNPRQGAETLTN
jgi:hypothetical protein